MSSWLGSFAGPAHQQPRLDERVCGRLGRRDGSVSSLCSQFWQHGLPGCCQRVQRRVLQPSSKPSDTACLGLLFFCFVFSCSMMH